VTWPNAGSALLPESGANVTLFADGVDVPPTQTSKGLRAFAVPDGASKVELTASFTVSFDAVHGTAPQSRGTISVGPLSAEVLSATQTYTVSNGALTEDPVADYGGGPTPLLEMKKPGGAGVVEITVRTEFVDIDPFWSQYAEHWDYFLSEEQPGTKTYVLGYTGGMPIIWFAVVPDAMATFANALPSCLVFYRPANKRYTYTKVNQPHQASAIARYLLKPKPDSDGAAGFWERDHGAFDGYNLMRCRFEDSIVQSQRALVMLHPWPSGGDFGVSSQAGLSTLCERALRHLWARNLICNGVASVSLGRFGLSGFSYGGNALWPALVANGSKVREVYAFDAVSTSQYVQQIIRWFNSHDSSFLRLANGTYNFDTYAAIQRVLDPTSVRPDLTVVPPSVAEYQPGHNSVFDHFVTLNQKYRDDVDTQHQWSVMGGQMISGKTAPYDLDWVETYFLNFLRASAFSRF
jgi:hypothetical protein